jgi:hypothetical protein
MSIASNTITGILGASFHDVTEEYAELLQDWYGEDLSLLDHDDEDLATAVRAMTRRIGYWRTGSIRMTPYERLRAKYEALIEMHQSLMEERRILKCAIRQQQNVCRSWIGTEREAGI